MLLLDAGILARAIDCCLTCAFLSVQSFKRSSPGTQHCHGRAPHRSRDCLVRLLTLTVVLYYGRHAMSCLWRALSQPSRILAWRATLNPCGLWASFGRDPKAGSCFIEPSLQHAGTCMSTPLKDAPATLEGNAEQMIEQNIPKIDRMPEHLHSECEQVMMTSLGCVISHHIM